MEKMTNSKALAIAIETLEGSVSAEVLAEDRHEDAQLFLRS